MSFSRPIFLGTSLAICLVAASCARSGGGVKRLAVLPSENLGQDANLSWVGQAIALAVSESMQGRPGMVAVVVESPREAGAVRATEILHSYFDGDAAGVHLHAILEDLDTGANVRKVDLSLGVPGDLLSASRRLVRDLTGKEGDPGTKSVEALKAVAEAWTSDDPNADLRRALAADPGYPLAALTLAQRRISEGRPDEAKRILAPLSAPGAAPLTAARANMVLAMATHDRTRVARAAEALARLMPADSDRAERAAAAHLVLHHYREAAAWYGRAVAVEPGRTELWNSRAYPLAWSGDQAGALESLARYQRGEPANPNTLDSLGEIHFRFQDYRKAEQYFLEAMDKSPDFQGSVALIKAARCRLLRGDRTGADELIDEYCSIRKNAGDPLAQYRRGQWLYQTGRRQKANALLEKIAAGDGPPLVRGEARSQLAVWALLAGDRKAARRHAEEAFRAAGGTFLVDALVARFLAEPAAATKEREQLANRIFRDPSLAGQRRTALLTACLLSGDFRRARELIEEEIPQSPPFGEDRWNVLLAWTMIEAGNAAEARQLLAVNPTIQPGAGSLLDALIFPETLYLRGRAAQETGDAETAVSAYRMYLDYTGQPVSVTGHQQDARQRLTRLTAR